MPFYSVFVKENIDYVSIGNFNRLKALKTPRFLKKRVKLIQDRYSEAQLEKLSKGWEPWNHWGKDDKKLSFHNRYGKFGGYAAYLFHIYRHKINRFRRGELQFKLVKEIKNRTPFSVKSNIVQDIEVI